MDLHSGTPFWQVGHERVAFPELRGDIACEVIVVGGGITGALVSYLLVQSGVDVVIVDKRMPGEGSTVASTGLLQYEIDTPLVDLIKKVGQEGAVHAYRRGLRAIDELEALADEVGGGCGFSRRESLYFASNFWHAWRLKREFECRKANGFDVRYLSRKQLAKISSIVAPAAIVSRGDAQIDPYVFTQRLLTKARAYGLRIFGNSEIKTWKESSDGVIAETPAAYLRARALVFASGYEAHRQLEMAPGSLCSTYAAVSEPIANFAGWPDGCLIWETSRPYFYARQTDDGRAMIGGEDTAFSQDHTSDDLLERKWGNLKRRFEKLFPSLTFTPSCTWAGTFAETKDGLAYIGKLPKRQNIYATLGYGGNGITFSAIAAKLIVDLYHGRPNPDAAVFSFER